MNVRSYLMNQESKGSLGATIMINYVSILEDRVSICITLPPRHMTRLRLVILCSTIIHHVVSWDGFLLLLVLAFGAEGRNSADTGFITNLTSLMPLRGRRGPFTMSHLDRWMAYLAFPTTFPGCCFLSWLHFNGWMTTNLYQFVRISKEEPLLISQQGAGVETPR